MENITTQPSNVSVFENITSKHLQEQTKKMFHKYPIKFFFSVTW